MGDGKSAIILSYKKGQAKESGQRRESMKELSILLLVAILAMGILLMILLHKITTLKKQTDDIVQEVKAYVAFVTAEPAQETRMSEHTSRDEKESQIIQAVLGEYFS